MTRAPTLVGINAWNRFAEARDAWLSFEQSLRGSREHADFLVVDDASDGPEIGNYFRPLAESGRIHYIRNADNLKLTRSWNVLLSFAVARGYDHVVQSNSDVFFAAGWLDRFAAHLRNGCEYLLPMTNNPGRHSSPLECHPQDIRNLWAGFQEQGDASSLSRQAMERISDRAAPEQLASGNGFFIGFRTDFLKRIVLRKGEYWSEAAQYLAANRGVGGDESEIRKRTGAQVWLAQDVYIHHFRRHNELGRSRQEFLKKAGSRAAVPTGRPRP